jgi:hypothetical protein
LMPSALSAWSRRTCSGLARPLPGWSRRREPLGKRRRWTPRPEPANLCGYSHLSATLGA